MNAGQIDRDEDARVETMRKKARSRPHLTHSSQTKRNKKGSFRLTARLGYTSAAVLGDVISRRIQARAAFEEHQSKNFQRTLVKDGYWQVPVEERPVGWEKLGVKEP